MELEKYRLDLLVFCNQLNMIGVRYLSSYLKDKGIEVRIIYMVSPPDTFVNMFSDELYARIISFCEGADAIGVSLTTNYFPEARRLSLKLKEKLDKPLIWGGVHPTIEVEESLQYADYVVMGEGEVSIYELIKALRNSSDISFIRNLAYKRNGLIVKNPLRAWEEIDGLPLPDTEFTSHYIIDNNELKRIDIDLMKKNMFTFSNKKRITYNISTARGCPHSCTYCVNYAYRELFGAKGYVRRRSVGKILEELRIILKKYPFIEYIFISDETLFVQAEEAIKDFACLYKKDIGLPLKIEFSPQTFDEKKLRYMLEAGAVELHLGVESGSDDTNYNIYQRKFPINRIKTILDVINKYRHQLEVAHVHILICNPFESLINTKETFRFIADIPNNFRVRFFPLVLFPGTRLFSMAKEAGFIRNKEEDVYLKTWNVFKSLKQADYYTICAILLYKLKRKLKISRFQSHAFYHFMSFPLVNAVLGSGLGRNILVKALGFNR